MSDNDPLLKQADAGYYLAFIGALIVVSSIWGWLGSGVMLGAVGFLLSLPYFLKK